MNNALVGEVSSQLTQVIESSRNLTKLMVDLPKRSALQALKGAGDTPQLKVFVVRNFAAELITRWTTAFSAAAGVSAGFSFSHYDDSMSSTIPTEADLTLVMLDFRRFTHLGNDLLNWIEDRVLSMRSESSQPILMLGSDDVSRSRRAWNHELETRLGRIPGVTVVDPGPSNDWDGQLAEAAQSPIYGTRAIELARQLAFRWIPWVTGRLVRLLIVDLDNTLYEGVLAEDGAGGIKVTSNHQALHRALTTLHDQGVLLGISSRNEATDVESLLNSRLLEPLTYEHFFAVEADWGRKSDHVARILKAANFSDEFAVFIDDNPGESLQVTSIFPALQVVYAETPKVTLAALNWFPGLWRPLVSSTDALRTKDLVANRMRQSLASGDPQSILTQLALRTTVHVRPSRSVARLAELSRKTNQFNTNLARLSESVLAGRCERPDAVVAGFSMADKFSDSGMVGCISGLVDGNTLVLDDIAISCRALGRGAEDIILNEIIDGLSVRTGATGVKIQSTKGPRNAPALAWLRRAAEPIDDEHWHWVRRSDLAALTRLVALVWIEGESTTHADGESSE